MKIGSYFHLQEEPIAVEKNFGLTNDLIFFVGEGNSLLRKGAIDALFCSEMMLPKIKTYTKWDSSLLFMPIADEMTDLPGLSINCRRDFLIRHPEWCINFVAATYRGWCLAKSDPDRAKGLLKEYHQKFNRLFDDVIISEQLSLILGEIDATSRPSEHQELSEEEFHSMRSAMTKAGLVSDESALSFEEFFFPVLKPETSERIEALQIESAEESGNPVAETPNDVTKSE